MGINGVATKLKEAKKVVIVPGYGLAVAKAQYATSEIVSILKSNGADVKFMIHPVVRAWEAKEVVMLKRSLGIGYAGVPNPLMYNENTVMLLGDAKCNLVDLRNELAKMLPSVCEV